MSAICGRCKEEEAVFECADCVGSKRRGELLPLCNGCSGLIHVGFLDEHQVVSVTIKQQKTVFEEQLGHFKSQGKYLQLKLNELNYAKQDIEQRSQYNQQAITQAFQAVWQTLKQRENELVTPLRDINKKKAAQLADCEKNVSRANAEFQSLCTDAQKLLQGNSVDFAQQYEQMKKKLEEFEISKGSMPFPTMEHPARLDVTVLQQSIKDLCLQAVADGEGPADDDATPKKKKEIEQATSPGGQEAAIPELQSPKEGDTLQVYVESRLDSKGHFWVSRNLSEDIANRYENLSFRIRQDFVQSPLAHVEIVEGMLCCGQFQEDHRWYRGRVEQVKKKKGLARIRWLDYAHDNEVPLAAVQPLKEEFQSLPFQALECSLFDNLDEDLPHQARWEFSDHTTNALLSCTILKQISTASPENKSQVYLVDLKNSNKGVDIKEKVLEKADEAKSNRDTIMCRDIRYMKDYVPPIGKATNTKKETTSEKAKDRVDTKEAKKQTKEDETVDINKDSSGGSEGMHKGSKEDGLQTDKEVITAEKTTGISKEVMIEYEGGVGDGDGMDKTRRVDAKGTEDAGLGSEDSGMDQQGSSGQEHGEQEMGSVREESLGGSLVIAREENSAHDAPTGSIEATWDGDVSPGQSVTSDQKYPVHDKDQMAAGTVDKAFTPTPGAVEILKRDEVIPDQNTPQDSQDPDGPVDRSGEEIPPKKQESQVAAGTSTSYPETSNNAGPHSTSSGQNSQPSDTHSPGEKHNEMPDDKEMSHSKIPTTADACVYSLEPDDDEEVDDHQLIELLASQGDRAMAHSPDNAFSDRGANSEGMAYREGGAYHPYSGSVGYHMAAGMFGGMHHPPVDLGLNPIVPSMETGGGSGGSTSMDAPKPDQGSFTGDGFKIVVDSSFSIYVATPLSDKGRFWASRLRGPAQESQLRRLMHDISMPFEPMTLDRLKEVKVVCVQTESGQWCRARVEGFVDDKVQVRYVDFGQADIVEEQRVKTLPVAYQLFPYQAIELSIATRHHSRFSDQAREAFLKYTQGRILTAKVVANESKIVYVTLSFIDENQLMYDISSAVLNINSETIPSNAEAKMKDRKHTAEDSRHGNYDEQNGGPVCEDYRSIDPQDARYDHQSDGRSHDRGSGDRCFVCNNFGHLSYDCPNKGRDPRDRNDRNYKNKGGSKKQNWGRRNRKY